MLSLFMVLALAGTPSPSPLPSLSPSPSPSPIIEIGHVTVNRISQQLSEVPQSISILTSNQILNTPIQELDDILRTVPGVDLLGQSGEQVHPTAGSIGMRGLGGTQAGISRALVMADGVPLNDPFFGYIQWGREPLDLIDHVEIVRGGGSPLWGNYALGGFMNIVTKQPASGTTLVDLGGGSYGTYRNSVIATVAPLRNTDLQGSFSCNGTNGFDQEPADALRPFDTPTSYHTCNSRLGFSYLAGDRFKMDAIYTYHENRQQLATVIDSNWQHMSTYTIDAKEFFGDNGSLTGNLFRTNSHFVTDNSVSADNITQNLDNVHNVPVNDVGGSLVWAKSFPDATLRSYTLGADFHSIVGENDTQYYDSTGQNLVRSDVGRGKQVFMAGFGRASIFPAHQLEVALSARYQIFQNLDGYDGTLGGLGVIPNQNWYSLTPRIDIRRTYANGFAWRGAYYTSFRAPDLSDLYYGYAANGYAMIPNPLLKPETLNGGEIGVDFNRPTMRTQLTLYRTQVSNFITFATLAVPPPQLNGFYVQQLVNASLVRAQGFEAETDWQFARRYSTTLSYTWADSIYLNNPTFPSSVGYQLADVPRNAAAASLTYKTPADWQVATQLQYVSATNWVNADHSAPPPPAYASADPNFLVNLSSSFPLSRTSSAYVQISNLLNARYIAAPGAYGPPMYGAPFQVFAGIRITSSHQ